MRAKNDASFYVASPSRLFSATRAKAGEMTRTASARGGGGGGREERERERRRDFFVFLWTRIGNLKSRIGNERFFQEEEEEVSVGILFELYYGKEMF